VLKAEQVPDEAYRAWREAFFSDSGGRAAIAAAINAWPGIEIEMVFMEEDYLILPLPTEKLG
jgi:hypothetical protein